jgi:hypothetical protein
MGCGGGGGSGGGIEPDPGEGAYTGKTTPAEIDENNATHIAAGAFAAGQAGMVMTSSEASQDDQGPTELQIDNFRTLKVPRILGDAARSMDLNAPLHQLSFRAEANRTVTGSDDGPCGGSVSYTITINDKSGEFEGAFIFSDYCDYGVTISGEADVKGTADPDSGDIITITFRFDNLSDGTMTMDGKMSMDFSDSPLICTLTAYLKDETTEKVYWAKNYSLNIYEYPGYLEVEIFGKFYHPDHGYVDVSTEEAFVIYDGDDWPSSGILLMIGANNTKVKLTAIDSTQCRIEADTDGDGVYDWDSGPLEWSNLHAFDEFEILASYVQYRTFGDDTENEYRGWMSFLNNGHPIEASDITDIALIGPDQNEVDITVGDFWNTEYYYGSWNPDDQQVYYSGPYVESGFSVYFPNYFPNGPTLAEGNYTYEATTMSGSVLSQTHYFPGKLELEVVDSATMNSEWIDGDLKLTWTLPDPVGPFDQVRVRLQSGDQIYLILRLANTASEVTIPQEWINNVKQLSNADTMDWNVLLYAYDSTTNNQYARSQSALKAIEDWDPTIPPAPPGEIQNPGFEQGATGWFKALTSGTDCSFTIDSDAYEGSQAAKLTVTNDGYCMLGNKTLIPIHQAGTYTFSYYAKVSGDVDHIQLAMWKSENPDETANTPVGYTSPNSFSGDYQYHELTVDLLAGDYIRLELGIDNRSGTGSVLFDSLELVND